ncbi:hypothetical protein Q9L42_020770 (plasmid) [Methylomarinum sp. Ch1-1]|uniref:Uncharacterized protein n=1 Tax=Methylomarinum roseum TaxID=3067653 RepID=A0AAU7P0M5_9GAMM|nr:hypothetical protein [Methylomarinum sp. Ch1-1]MDP4518953.1 hypothetical protein [Methylomarinum sp. Ch1-1]MDP4523353.1 hypothetical protein [Methylomarinum sp. Ch1-1]
MRDYGYYINLDERGEFFADVRDANEQTIFEIHGFDVFEDGFMKDKNDIAGLQKMLIDQQVIKPSDEILPMVEFEERLTSCPIP